jgi:hypothetical protein
VDELRAARACLEHAKTEIECTAVQLSGALDAFTPQPDAEKRARIKAPSHDDYFAWIYACHGYSQEKIAKLFLEFRHVSRDQGTVCRMIARVDEWHAAGGIAPPITEVVSDRRAQPMDPAKLDLGANKERRPPRQRNKKP